MPLEEPKKGVKACKSLAQKIVTELDRDRRLVGAQGREKVLGRRTWKSFENGCFVHRSAILVCML